MCIRDSIEGLKKDFRRDLIADGLSEKEADQFIEKNFGSTDAMFKNTLKQLGAFKDETDSANLERLAINETVLTYALANSLKDKDRLTQKDIQINIYEVKRPELESSTTFVFPAFCMQLLLTWGAWSTFITMIIIV